MGWKAKFIFILFVYFAGFATATYVAGPKPKADPFASNKAFNFEAVVQEFNGQDKKSEKFIRSFNAGLHKSFGFSKDAAVKMTDFLKEQIEQRKNGQTGFK